jgi:hypothetical protein
VVVCDSFDSSCVGGGVTGGGVHSAIDLSTTKVLCAILAGKIHVGSVSSVWFRR